MKQPHQCPGAVQFLYPGVEILKFMSKWEIKTSSYSIRCWSRQRAQSKRDKAADFLPVHHTVYLTIWGKNLRQPEGRKKTSMVNIKSPVMFCIKGIRSELSTVLPGSVLSPWCDLCSLHPLWWAWFCCSTSHSTESSVSGSPPAQSQTPAGHQERKKQWLHHNRTPVSE